MVSYTFGGLVLTTTVHDSMQTRRRCPSADRQPPTAVLTATPGLALPHQCRVYLTTTAHCCLQMRRRRLS